MTQTTERLDVGRLQMFLNAHGISVSGPPLTSELLFGGRSNITYRLSDGESVWVLRRPPFGGLTPSAHDMFREYRVIAALHDTGVPVPRPVIMCADASVLGASFSVYEFVSGEVIRNRSDLARHSPDEVRRCAFALIDVLALLHEVPYEDIGLKDFGRPQGYLGRQVSRWYEQWRRVATRELPDIDLLYSKLAGSVPRETGASIVHGDFRIDNAILDEHDVGSVRAVVDWEMATLGDPLADLALHLVYRDPIFGPVLGGSAAAVSDRMPSPTQLTERYTHASGRDVCDLNFHMALGYFKIAVIAEGIHVRHSGGFTVGEGFGTVAAAVPLLAASGLRALAGWRSG